MTTLCAWRIAQPLIHGNALEQLELNVHVDDGGLARIERFERQHVVAVAELTQHRLPNDETAKPHERRVPFVGHERPREHQGRGDAKRRRRAEHTQPCGRHDERRAIATEPNVVDGGR